MDLAYWKKLRHVVPSKCLEEYIHMVISKTLAGLTATWAPQLSRLDTGSYDLETGAGIGLFYELSLSPWWQ